MEKFLQSLICSVREFKPKKKEKMGFPKGAIKNRVAYFHIKIVLSSQREEKTRLNRQYSIPVIKIPHYKVGEEHGRVTVGTVHRKTIC